MKNYILWSAALLLYGCSQNKVEFKPVEKMGDRLVINRTSSDPTFIEGLGQVLGYYDVKYERKNKSTVLIEESLYSDKELMWNYTSKARDKEWLETH